MLGTGEEIKATRVCRQVKLHLAELEIMADFFQIPLESSEVILGYQWLASLGESHMNWVAMTMRFIVGGTRIQLQGDHSLCKTQVSLRSMVQTIQHEGARPISVRPYRYPQILKDEIERIVVEMLAVGIIQPSNSPFTSPVLLVKKNDGSWRFCVDY